MLVGGFVEHCTLLVSSVVDDCLFIKYIDNKKKAENIAPILSTILTNKPQ